MGDWRPPIVQTPALSTHYCACHVRGNHFDYHLPILHTPAWSTHYRAWHMRCSYLYIIHCRKHARDQGRKMKAIQVHLWYKSTPSSECSTCDVIDRHVLSSQCTGLEAGANWVRKSPRGKMIYHAIAWAKWWLTGWHIHAAGQCIAKALAWQFCLQTSLHCSYNGSRRY